MGQRLLMDAELISIQPFDSIEGQLIQDLKIQSVSDAGKDVQALVYGLIKYQDKVLLLDDILAQLWLPPRFSFSLLRDQPKSILQASLMEVLGLDSIEISHSPLMMTKAQPMGHSREAKQICIWYVIDVSEMISVKLNTKRHYSSRWFDMNLIPFHNSDPEFHRVIEKLQQR